MTGKHFLGVGLLFTVVLVVPALLADDKKPAAKDDKTKQVDSDTLPNGSYTGKMLDVPDKDGNFSAQIDLTHLAPKDTKNPNANNQALVHVAKVQARVGKLEAELAVAKKPQEAQKKALELETALAQLQVALAKAGEMKAVTEHKSVDFQMGDDAKVRIMTLPSRFDDDGKVKAYTDEEKTALKGKDTTLPGYEAKLADLKIGDLVRIRLFHSMAAKANDPGAADATKDAAPPDKDTPKDTTLAKPKAKVTLIVILNEDQADKDKTGKDSPGKKPK
jgi:hypothetical protein